MKQDENETLHLIMMMVNKLYRKLFTKHYLPKLFA